LKEIGESMGEKGGRTKHKIVGTIVIQRSKIKVKELIK
jgi:hypothetical protein